VHDFTFSQQVVSFPVFAIVLVPLHREACRRNGNAVSRLKLLKEYSDTNHKKLWDEVCIALIENWNGLAHSAIIEKC
jgi:hypothetical protein